MRVDMCATIHTLIIALDKELAVDVMSLSFNCDLGQKIVMGFMAMINDSKC